MFNISMQNVSFRKGLSCVLYVCLPVCLVWIYLFLSITVYVFCLSISLCLGLSVTPGMSVFGCVHVCPCLSVYLNLSFHECL